MLGELYDGEFESMEHNGRMDACIIKSMNRWNDYVNGKDVEPMTIAEPCSDVISRDKAINWSGMTRFSNFTDEELDAMESAFCNEGLTYLVDEIRRERRYREDRK